MTRTTRLTSVLAGRGKAVAAVAAGAAVLAGAGAASAATVASPAKTAADVSSAGVLAAPHGAGAALATPAATTLNPAAAHAAPVKHAADAAPVQRAADAVVKTSADAKAARPAAPARPFEVYDSVTPSQVPAGARLATYADGGYAVSPSQVAHRGHVLWIDTSGSDPRAAALDVEPGDATPGQAATWAWHKLHSAAGQVAIIYTMRSEWAAAQAAVATLPSGMQHQVRWWIADPTGVPHIVPGASATQWYWGHNYDITTARPGSGM
jgi:hypothetical protein